MNINYEKKYLKYKNKYLSLKGGKIYKSIKDYKKDNEKCIIARVLRGKKKEDFKTLASLDRKLVFLTSDGHKLLNLENTGKILKEIGYPADYIKELQKNNTNFKLALLDECKKKGEYILATWDNLLDLLLKAYPEIKQKLKTTKNWKNILKKTKPNKNNKITYETLLRDFTIQNLRDFMNYIENINNLYTGTGNIKDSDGKITGKEYITQNTEKKWNNNSYPHLIKLPNLKSNIKIEK